MQLTKTLGEYQLVPLVLHAGQQWRPADQRAAYERSRRHAELNNGLYDAVRRGDRGQSPTTWTRRASAGSLTIGPTIGGTECADPTLTVTTGVTGSDTCNRGTNLFAAGRDHRRGDHDGRNVERHDQ